MAAKKTAAKSTAAKKKKNNNHNAKKKPRLQSLRLQKSLSSRLPSSSPRAARKRLSRSWLSQLCL